jgi:hypothetical protein
MSLKTIQMDPTHLKITKTKRTKKTIIPPSVMINQPNLRQILLDKLMKHRKTQKRNEPSILNNNFDEQCSNSYPTIPPVILPISSPVSVIEPPTEPLSTILKDKPYGVLKNGIKPTFKTWNKSQKNIQSQPIICDIPEPRVEIYMNPPIEIKSEPLPITVSNPESNPDPKHETIIQKTPIKIGKSKKNKTVQIWIACNKTRKQRGDENENLRKTNLTTVKNYLKNHRLIKVGSTAPTNLLRQIYENAKSYGDVTNENKENLLYNFEKDSDAA